MVFAITSEAKISKPRFSALPTGSILGSSNGSGGCATCGHWAIDNHFDAYFPYGEEATDPAQDRIRYKFTGHKRDLGDPTSTEDDLDHMHARMTNPRLGRFLSVDPVQQIGRAVNRREKLTPFQA